MTWVLAFLIIGLSFIVCAFALFMTVYLKELSREEKIIRSYGDSIKNGFVDVPIVYLDKLPPAKVPLNPAPGKDKKIIN